MELENLDKDQINRLWEYRLHANNAFYTRFNFFLIFESVILGPVGVLSSTSHPPFLAIRLILALGLTLTVLWGYIQARQKYLFDNISFYVKELLPEYRALLARRKKWPVSSIWLEAYLLPLLIALIWVALLFFLF